MKRFIKGRWFPLVIAVFIVAVIIFIMAKLGFRVVYVPEPEDTWEAASAVASWVGAFISCVGVLASFLAIWYAIQVPKTIADRQDQIALFEKRYECFQFFEKCAILLEKSLKQNGNNEIIKQVCSMLDVQAIHELNKYDFEKKLGHFEFLLHQMEFLFPEIQEKDAKELYDALQSYLVAVCNQKDIEENKLKYMYAMGNFGKYTNKIWNAMTISKSKNT